MQGVVAVVVDDLLEAQRRPRLPNAARPFAQLSGAYWLAAHSPIYGAIERQGRREDREVPRPATRSQRTTT